MGERKFAGAQTHIKRFIFEKPQVESQTFNRKKNQVMLGKAVVVGTANCFLVQPSKAMGGPWMKLG